MHNNAWKLVSEIRKKVLKALDSKILLTNVKKIITPFSVLMAVWLSGSALVLG